MPTILDRAKRLFSSTPQRSVAEIINETDSIVRASLRLPQIVEESRNEPTVLRSTSNPILGKLKKRFAPNRNLSYNGMFINRFNMSDIYSAYAGENLFKFAVDKYTESCVRNGGFIKSKNPAVVQYINKRIKEMEIVSNSTFGEYMTDFFSTGIMYGNIYVAKHRQKNVTSGNPYRRFDGKRLDPIASLYIEDPRKLILGEGPSGRMRYVRIPVDVKDININHINPSIFTLDKDKIRNDWDFAYYPGMMSTMNVNLARLFKVSSRRKKTFTVYEEHEIDHIRYHHIAGEKIAMPPFWPTLNDIDSLRRIEENVELLVYQYGHPLLHGKVGSDERPGDTAEIEEVTRKLEDIESNGFMITDNRTMIEMIGAESQALRLEGYLQYFYRRVLSGLWLSEVTVGHGDTANRSTANTLDKLSQEKVQEWMRIFSNHFNNIMIEWLQEAGVSLNFILDPDNIPTFEFNEVDIEGKIKKEAHILTLFQGDLLSQSEARREMGKEPMSDDDKKEMFVNLVTIPAKESASSAASNQAEQRNTRPSNQYGKKTSPSPSQNK